MKLKYIFLLFILCAGCNKDTDIDENDLLMGQVNGKNFVVSSARYTVVDNDRLAIEVFGELSNSASLCDDEAIGLRLKFRAEDTNDRQELYIDLNNFEAFTIEMIDPQLASSIIASEGYFDIISKNDESFKAKLDITVDENNFLKGEFEAIACE